MVMYVKYKSDFVPKEQYIHTVRLTSELVDLRVGYANPIRAHTKCEQSTVTN